MAEDGLLGQKEPLHYQIGIKSIPSYSVLSPAQNHPRLLRRRRFVDGACRFCPQKQRGSLLWKRFPFTTILNTKKAMSMWSYAHW